MRVVACSHQSGYYLRVPLSTYSPKCLVDGFPEGQLQENLHRRRETLTKYTPAWYATTRARAEARATREQAEELRRVLEE